VELEALAGMIFTLILVGMIGGFVLLIPVSRRLGLFLEAWIQEKKGLAGAEEVAHLRRSIQALEKEVSELAERQQFTDRLLENRQPESLPAGVGKGAERPRADGSEV